MNFGAMTKDCDGNLSEQAQCLILERWAAKP